MRLSAVGDVCNAVPLVRTLQKHWPATRITWVVGQLEATLVGDIPGIEFIIFNKRDGWRAFQRLRKNLQGRSFDVFLHIQAALRASIASLAIKAPLRIGFDRGQARDFQWWFCNQHIADIVRGHVLDGFMGFAEFLGIPDRTLQWDIPIPAAARAFAREHIGDSERALVISPCSSQRARNWRNWSVAHYARIADYAARQHGLKVILTGGPTEIEHTSGREIRALADSRVTSLIGATSLKQLLALLSRASLLVCPDSGPAHMATAVGLPVIGLYATSNPLRTGPYLSQQWVVNKYPDATRKYLGKDWSELRWGARVRHPDAMSLIRPEDVMEKMDQLLSAQTSDKGELR